MQEKKWFNSDFIYDLESYPNVFTMTIIHASGKHLRQYEISNRVNQIDDIAKCLRYLVQNKCRMVGFNNLGYDYQLIHLIIDKLKQSKVTGKSISVTAKELYNLTSEIINKMKKSDGNYSGIPEKDHYVKQVDLYKIHHFDNKAKATSLKMLEVNMRSRNVEDLPFDVGKVLSDEEIDTLLVYNKHDVMETLKFYYYSYNALKLRDDLSGKFGFDCTNFNDTKIGETLFINRLEEEKLGVCYTYGKFGRKINQTKRDSIDIGECLFPYINFKTPEFQAVKDWLSEQVVSETKGVFNDYEEHQIGDLAKYANMKTKRVLLKNTKNLDNKGKSKPDFDVENKEHMEELERLKSEFQLEHPVCDFEVVEKKTKKLHRLKVTATYRVVEAINTVIDGGEYVFGTGGIHMSLSGETVVSDDNWQIVDVDVTSMYPSISIANNVHPEHLGLTFCKVYKDLFEERKRYAKNTGENLAIKLALNGIYGKSNSEYSPMYDPKYTLTITVNGQLSLAMLAERFILLGCRIIQCNTDGVTALVKRDKIDDFYKIVRAWEKVTGLLLEDALYSKMAIADVNNYIAVYQDGKVKSKGRYEVAHYESLGWSKNHSAMIVPMAAMECIVKGVPVEETIRNHEDAFDFMLRAKVPRSSKLFLCYEDGGEVQQQNICRYYPSQEGGKLVKLMPPLTEGGEWRRLGIDTEYSVLTCNNMDDFNWEKLNYDYYISEANKLVEGVRKPLDTTPEV